MRKKLKLLSLALPLIIVISCFAPLNIPVFADDSGFIYRIEGDEAILTGIAKSVSGDIVVPETLGGYNVVMIDGAFKDKDNIESVALPDTVTVITKESFSHCSLKNIKFSSNLLRIDQEAFFACVYLETVEMPDSLTQLGKYAFSRCSSLKTVGFSKNLGFIDEEAFNGCGRLEIISVPDNTSYIARDAFKDTLYYNTESNWENGVLYIGKHLIAAKSAQISGRYVVKEGTKSISYSAFFKCNNLTEIVFPVELKRIDVYAFFSCNNIKHVFYVGTPNQRHAIKIEKNNSSISNATWLYGYDPDVVEYNPGDINGDGDVNNKDLTCFFQYLSDWNVKVESSVVDVNGDKVVNNKDLIRLFQYLSGWDVKIYSISINFDYSDDDTGPVISF